MYSLDYSLVVYKSTQQCFFISKPLALSDPNVSCAINRLSSKPPSLPPSLSLPCCCISQVHVCMLLCTIGAPQQRGRSRIQL